MTEEAERQRIARDRSEQFFAWVNDVIHHVNRYRHGMPIKLGYELLEKRESYRKRET